MLKNLSNDLDPMETLDWEESIENVICKDGIHRAKFLINQLIRKIQNNTSNNFCKIINSDYINTIDVSNELEYPGDLDIERKIRSAVRWNAIIMVLRASKKNLDLGGHISSFQSSATIYEVCFNHFFRAMNKNDGGDLVYFQGHISPGIYARAFLEGRLTRLQLDNFRQEVNKNGLSSYPHPQLMSNFWQFPTVSMGLGPICAIYQAKFLKYLKFRGLKETSNQTVYAFLGDGEMDEPESKGALSIAAREELDNLIFIVNCNLQRLDGPVIGNGKVIDELENIFNGAGWAVIKVIWGSGWDKLLHKDSDGKLIQLMNETIDGDYQTFKSKDGNYVRKNFFGKYKETLELVKNMSDNEIWKLNRGGHDPKKLYNALKLALNIQKQPVVILAHTIKGYGIGQLAEGKNIAHQIKKIDINTLFYIQKRFDIPLNKEEIESLSYLNFSKDSVEYKYLHKQRNKLGGYLPTRLSHFTTKIIIPNLSDFQILLDKPSKKISTTIAFVRFLNILLNNVLIKDRVVPIIADEARTFGMEGLFRKIGIYNFKGQKYISQDQDILACYREDQKGQILQEGINELGAGASWIAAGTSYSTNNFPMIPFYIYYSMFGFQRIGDLLWAAADQQTRGFLIGATSGRTTLNGEGLQHEDGHSHIQSLTIPNCKSYDPAFAYELTVIMHDGIRRMYGSMQENIYYYITTVNENYDMPGMIDNISDGICKGIYKLESFPGNKNKVQLLGSGSILRMVREAASILSLDYNIASDVYSVTSFTELARDGQDCERWNLLHPTKNRKIPYVETIMNKHPAIATTDYMKLFAEQIRGYVPAVSYHVLGTDGFGRSDSREKLRTHFEINASYIVVSALFSLVKFGNIDKKLVSNVIDRFNIDINKLNPRLV
ncbi:Pyruvate dehydrogenase E1 component [Buchnera aphidicola (Eriosoma grossulariae)]|uniref:pyruvate dehydrogenase (acetyl-transferring), homodimeric type n=1 Tax=Buchnera aphidicola TaxID=9 RepID=UPI003463E2F8